MCLLVHEVVGLYKSMPHRAWAPMAWLYPQRRAPKGDEFLELLQAVEQAFGLEPSEPPSVVRVM